MSYAEPSDRYVLIRIVFITASMLLVLILGIIAYIVVVRDKLFRRLTSLSKRIIVLVSGIIISTAVCGFYTANIFVNYFENMLSTTLKNATTLATMSYDGEIIDRFQSVEQSDSKEYNDFFNMAAEQFSNFDDSWSARYYIGFTTIRDNSMYVLFYSDGSTSLFTPLAWELESAFGDPYRKVDETRETLLSQMIDYEGKWLYGIAPVLRKDNSIAGYSEIGTYAGIFRNQVIKTAVSSIYMLLGLIAVLIFFFIEVTFAFEILSSRRTDTPWYEKFGLKYDRKIIRIPAFLIYTIINIPLYLFPLIMKDMCKDGFLGMSTDIAISLPLSFNMLGILLASFCSPKFVKKVGWQKGVLSGVAIIAISYLVCAFVYEPITFTLVAFLVGVGTGMSYIGMYDFVRLSGKSLENESENSEYISIINAGMFAGANCGVVFGTMVYTSFGFRISYLVAALMSILSGMFIYAFMPNIKDTAPDGKTQHKSINVARFVLNPEVWLFSLLILIPVSISYFFVVHFVPVYFDIQGGPPDLASLVFLLNGLVVIYFGPMLTRNMVKRMGLKLSAVASSLLVVIPFILFVLYPSIYMTILVAVALGFTEGFGQSTRIDYFANLPVSKQYGESEAVGIYNTIEGIGQIIAPTIFGYIILIGTSRGMMMFTVIIGAASVLYLIIKSFSKTRYEEQRGLGIN